MSNTPDTLSADDQQRAQKLVAACNNIRSEVARVIVGQQEVVEQLLIAILARGHCLLEGVPGLAKTLMVRSLADAMTLSFQRIQFTPDLMPADITGTDIIQENKQTGHRDLVFERGPIFTQMLLADEINRTPPKTQSALLEAMQEHQVTAAGRRYPLDEPFFVLATQNPIEMEGTYPLPEAQLDRFMFNVVMNYLPERDEVAVVKQTTSTRGASIEPIFSGEDVQRFHELVRRVPVADEMVRYAVHLAAASRPNQPGTPGFINDWVSWGAGTRAAQFLILAAKARALLRGRAHVTAEDVRVHAGPVLRHRILLNDRAEAEGAKVDDVVAKLLATVPSPVGA